MLGSLLIDRLMEAGEEVICLNNYFTGRKPINDLVREQVKWQPTVSLEQGLAPKIECFRKVLGIRDQPEA